VIDPNASAQPILHIVTTQPRAAVDRVIDLPPPGVGFQSGVYVPLNDVVLGDTGGAQAVLNGNLAVSWPTRPSTAH